MSIMSNGQSLGKLRLPELLVYFSLPRLSLLGFKTEPLGGYPVPVLYEKWRGDTEVECRMLQHILVSFLIDSGCLGCLRCIRATFVLVCQIISDKQERLTDQIHEASRRANSVGPNHNVPRHPDVKQGK